MDQLRSLANEFNLNTAQQALIDNATKGLNKSSKLYKCLQKTKSLEDIESCFKRFGKNADADVVGIEIKPPRVKKTSDDIADDNAVWLKSDFNTWTELYDQHLKENAKNQYKNES